MDIEEEQEEDDDNDDLEVQNYNISYTVEYLNREEEFDEMTFELDNNCTLHNS